MTIPMHFTAWRTSSRTAGALHKHRSDHCSYFRSPLKHTHCACASCSLAAAQTHSLPSAWIQSFPPSLPPGYTALIQLTYRQKKTQLPSPFLSTQPTSKFQYPSGMLRTATVAMPADISSFLGMLTQDFQRSPGKAWPLWQESKVTICCWP